MAVSFAPDQMDEGGGLHDDFNGTIERARFTVHDYGKEDLEVLVVRMDIVPDEEEDIEPFPQYYSCGKKALELFSPSEDGEEPLDWESEELGEVEGPFIAPVEETTKGLVKSSNFALFVNAAIEAGFPRDMIGGDVRIFEGVHAHFGLMAQPKRSGIQREDGRIGQVLVFTEILEMPGGSKAKRTSTKTSSKKTSKTSTSKTSTSKTSTSRASAKAKRTSKEDEEPLEDRVARAIVALLEESEEGVLSVEEVHPQVIGGFQKREKALSLRLLNGDDFADSRDEFELIDGEYILAQ